MEADPYLSLVRLCEVIRECEFRKMLINEWSTRHNPEYRETVIPWTPEQDLEVKKRLQAMKPREL